MPSHITADRSQVEPVQTKVFFLSTYQGAVKLTELCFGALANLFHNWCLCYSWYTGSKVLLNMATPFFIVSFWINVLLLLLHLCNLNNVWKGVNWRVLETVFCTVCAAFSFIFTIIEFWGAWDGTDFRFHFFLGGIVVLLLFLSFAVEAFLLLTGRVEGVIEWSRRSKSTATVSPA